MYFSLGLLCFLIAMKPYEMEQDTTMEVINECIIISVFYLGLILQDLQKSEADMKYNLGFVGMGLVSLCLLANLIFFAKGIIAQIRDSIRKRRY